MDDDGVEEEEDETIEVEGLDEEEEDLLLREEGVGIHSMHSTYH